MVFFFEDLILLLPPTSVFVFSAFLLKIRASAAFHVALAMVAAHRVLSPALSLSWRSVQLAGQKQAFQSPVVDQNLVANHTIHHEKNALDPGIRHLH